MTPLHLTLAAIIATASQATAAPVHVWHGPGDRACAGRCDVDWAISYLTDQQRADLVHARQSAPELVMIEDGDNLTLMTYFAGEPLAMTGVTVAVLDAPEPATGWRVTGGWFVLVHGCQNWAFLLDVPPVTSVDWPTPTVQIATVTPFTGIPWGWSGNGGGTHWAPPYVPPLGQPVSPPAGSPVIPPVSPPTPSPVPLPASGWLLLAAMVAMAWRSRPA